MIGWHRGVQVVQRNSLHGHLLADIFIGKQHGFIVVLSYLNAISNALQLLQFSSAYVNDYYHNLWLTRSKRLFRVSIKLFLTTCILRILTPGLLCPVGGQVYSIWWSAGFLILVLIYLATFRQIGYQQYEILALLITSIHIIIQFPVSCKVPGLNLPSTLPVYITIFSAFAMLPLSLEVSVCLVAVYITLSEGLDKLYDQVRAENRTYVKPSDPIPWVKFDLNRLITEGYRLNPRSAHILAMRALEWTFICFAAVYVRFWNNIRRRFVFFKLGKSVQARAQRDTARRGRVCWIEAIVPSKVSKEYQRLLKENECLDKTEWIYIQSYESVTMLFADIVGFTKMSSGLTASQVVNMLGSLVRQFDALCEIKHCEKLGLIGDCYYCVSGCPDHFRYHARSCTEMGLGMCEILKSFNQVFGTKINIRVGVHTGRVHAAVIGAIRFHYDVYSYDAIIANELEQTGKPGLVHISQTTYDQVHKHYRAIPGPELVINREDTFGWARRVPETVRILTYFIEPSSTNIRQTIYSMPEMRDESPSNTTSATLSSDLNWSSFNSSSGLPSEEEKEPDRQSMWIEYRSNAQGLADIKMSHQTNAMKLKRDIALIDDLRADPANHRLLFTQPPLTSILSQFRSPEIEWHYQLHIKQAVGPVFADSPKLARICDAVVLLLVNTLIIAIVLIVNFQRQSLLFSPLLLTLAVIICWILCFTGTHYPDRIESPFLQTFYNVCVHPVAYECILGIYTLLPAVVTSALAIDPMRPQQFSEVADVYFTLMSISTFTHCIPSSSAAWGRGISAALTLACGFLRWGSHEFSSGEESGLCLTGKVVKNGVNLRNEELISFYQAAVSWTLIWILSRDTERTSKLCFFVHREAEIESEAAEIAAKEANVLLYNIIPKYVFCDLERIGRENLSDRSSSLRYAVTHEMIAVAFISISNFFSTLYREDHEGGAASLRMLHRIICSFDSLLENFQYVEKIKSIRENYLVAAGLDRELVRHESKKNAYMVELMRYCMMARDRLHNFSQTVLHDEVDLVVKIGYNVGPATAGIIGTAKPHYDIWGDTVNVASRMCYTGIPGMIQVTEVAREELENTFYFSYRGEFFVKGKGHMRTYICDGGK